MRSKILSMRIQVILNPSLNDKSGLAHEKRMVRGIYQGGMQDV